MFSRLLVSIAYFLQDSPYYRHTKQFFYNLLENPDSRLKANFDIVMIALVMFSVFLLIYEVDTPLTALDMQFEQTLILIFTLEYLLRGWLYNDCHKIILAHYEKTRYLNIPFSLITVLGKIFAQKWAYMSSPLALIDLLAILPSYRPLRMLRLFLIFRLFKLFRYFNSLKLFTEVLASKRFELYTLAIFLSFVVFIGSTAIYLFEKPTNSSQVAHLFDAVYFTIVTVSTVGYGDITPHTTGGRIVAMVLILSGLGVFSFLTSIMVSAFNDKMQDMRENQTYTELKRCRDYVIICGFGRVGEHLAARLKAERQHFVIIDINADNVSKAKRLGYLVIQADASKNAVLLQAGLNQGANSVVCTTGNDVVNVYITLSSRHLNPDIRIVSRANNPDTIKKLYQAGASDVIQPFAIAGLVAAEYIGQPVAFEAIFGILKQEKQYMIDTLTVTGPSFIEAKTLAELDFIGRKLVLLGIVSDNPAHNQHKNRYQVSHQHFYFNPPAHFVLHSGDVLVLLGRDVSIGHLRQQIARSRFNNSRKS
ncbi:NAD-binding protein [Methylovulum psychrotolerans]|uniref:BK channel n=1 Tax=Methylovulum psychrotolerans TaxID=1704499 RepID=A0A1Z4C114_9GAMM|nr:NAD-binding protein [Methylovulum psychrotolerans]ASF47201.1 potassium channel protein [Methylovulum psychrotolerans]MBT9099662.1 NAD-binding protein [Methylovulum psychrotolerans]